MNTRTCKTCNETKPLMDFYCSKSGNLMSECKECTKARTKRNRLINLDHYREYEKHRAMLPHRVAARAEYQRTESGKDAIRRSHQRFRERNPIKRSAHIAVGNAIRDGVLVRKPCEVCGAKGQAHHDDYSKPLEVRWLCQTHHSEWHKRNTPLCPGQTEAA